MAGTRLGLGGASLAAAALLAMFVAAPVGGATSCTPTGFVRDSIDLTAAVINPSAPVSGALDATGCNIGVYFGPGSHGKVVNADIGGANYYGVVNDGGDVDVSRSTIHDIGETPLNGTQHGVGIYFAFGSSATGSITLNTLSNYQKGGIVVNGTGSSASIVGNRVIGQGPVGYIAQNGIQVGYGARAVVLGNTVTGNAYSGLNDASSGGIILVGGPWYGGDFTTGVLVSGNTVTGNDVGIWLSNLNADASAAATPTRDTVLGNTVTNGAVTNTTGNTTTGYQAGIADQGDGDWIVANVVCGVGYTPVAGDQPYLRFIDADSSFTNDVHLVGNRTCSTSSGPPHHRPWRFWPQPGGR